MKNICIYTIIIMTLITGNVSANPMFCDGCRNSVSLYATQSTGSGTLFKLIYPPLWETFPQTFMMIEYSQPITFFRLPARQNISIAQNFGYNSSRGLSFGTAGISIDVSLFDWRGFYIGVGIGPYMRDVRDRWVDSRLVFGEKFFIGKKISNRWNLELSTLHFSNGNLTEKNAGFNFTGLSVRYSF